MRHPKYWLIITALAGSGCGNTPNSPTTQVSGNSGVVPVTNPVAPQSLGEPVSGLSPELLARFEEGKEAFGDDESAEPIFGPIFNGKSCVECHSLPVVGGGGVQVETRFGQFVGERFEPLEIKGGSLLQSQALPGATAEAVPPEANVVAGRRATSLLGAGLVEAIPDQAILDYATWQSSAHPQQAGQVNWVTSFTDGRAHVGRFGWKCQVATVMDFSGDAYANEMGISSAAFPFENVANKAALSVAAADLEDQPDTNGVRDVDRFADFMRFLAPPAARGGSEQGRQTFHAIGCAVCHNPAYPTVSSIPALNGKTLQAYSDFLLHDVGTGDGIAQGNAPANKLRTAPLMGVSGNPSFLHDGRADSIEAAVLAHGGEALPARGMFEKLSDTERRELLNFLQSL